MLAPAPRPGATPRPAPKSPQQVAREMIAQLNAWGAERPEYRGALHDCAEEIAWAAKLRPAEAVTPARAVGLKQGTIQVITTLRLWAELRPEYARSLRVCEEEIAEISERRERNSRIEQGGGKGRAREAVLLSFETAEVQTCREIAAATGFKYRRVWRALVRLQQLGLIRDIGCGAKTHADGFRTRNYALVHTRP